MINWATFTGNNFRFCTPWRLNNFENYILKYEQTNFSNDLTSSLLRKTFWFTVFGISVEDFTDYINWKQPNSLLFKRWEASSIQMSQQRTEFANFVIHFNRVTRQNSKPQRNDLFLSKRITFQPLQKQPAIVTVFAVTHHAGLD